MPRIAAGGPEAKSRHSIREPVKAASIRPQANNTQMC